jgi:hypothetical protein
MKPQKPVGGQFEMIWSNTDAIQLCVSAWNGALGGVAEIYQTTGDFGGRRKEEREEIEGAHRV